MRINNNIMAYNAQRNLGASAMSMGKSIEKLSSGLRINRAADDASGLVISQKLRAQTSGLRQATRNAQDGISVVQTAEGGLNEVHTMLNRMRDLAVQAANTGANDETARQAAQKEFVALRDEIDRIGSTTSFGGTNLLDGSFGVSPASAAGFDADDSLVINGTNNTITIDVASGGAATHTIDTAGGAAQSMSDIAADIQAGLRSELEDLGGANKGYAENLTVTATQVGNGATLEIKVDGLEDGETFTLAGTFDDALGVDFGTIVGASGSGGDFQVGADAGGSNVINVSIGAVSSTTLGDLTGTDTLSTLNLDTDPSGALERIDVAIGQISDQRGGLGAVQNRLESTISNLQVTAENLAASESRIRDVDVASEMVNFTRTQILQQAGTAMLGQANQVPQSVLRLLG